VKPQSTAISDLDTSPAARVHRLAQNVERAESVRAVKRVQETYAQYSQFGLWTALPSRTTSSPGSARGRTASSPAACTRRWCCGRSSTSRPTARARRAAGGILDDGPLAVKAEWAAHWLTQPVILVASDGRSASIRSRLFQPGSS